MSTNNITFQEVAELASHLSPEEQSRLLAWIGSGLDATHAGSASESPSLGSATAILRALRESPHPSPEDVDALEQVIADSKIPVRYEGIFDDEDAK